MSRWASSFDAIIAYTSKKLWQQAGVGRLTLLFVVAALGVFVVVDGNVTAEVLFQSPQSPPAEPAPTATPPPPEPTPTPPPPPTSPPEPAPPEETIDVVPTEEPIPEEVIPEEEPLPEAEEASVEQQVVEPTPTLPPPTEEPVAAPELQAEAELQPEPFERRRERDDFAEEEGPRNFILDQAELIDTVAVSGAYIWLCCGIGLLLIAPLFLMLLYIRGRSRIIQDEEF